MIVSGRRGPLSRSRLGYAALSPSAGRTRGGRPEARSVPARAVRDQLPCVPCVRSGARSPKDRSPPRVRPGRAAVPSQDRRPALAGPRRSRPWPWAGCVRGPRSKLVPRPAPAAGLSLVRRGPSPRKVRVFRPVVPVPVRGRRGTAPVAGARSPCRVPSAAGFRPVPRARSGAGARVVRRGPSLADARLVVRRDPSAADGRLVVRRVPSAADGRLVVRRGPSLADGRFVVRRGPSADARLVVRRDPSVADGRVLVRRDPSVADGRAFRRGASAAGVRGALRGLSPVAPSRPEPPRPVRGS